MILNGTYSTAPRDRLLTNECVKAVYLCALCFLSESDLVLEFCAHTSPSICVYGVSLVE